MSEAAPSRPVLPRHAASLVLVRMTPHGPEVLMGKRPPRSAFAPDVFVFPGGRVDPADLRVKPARPLALACAGLTGAPPRLAQALAVAALRETWEETGLAVGDIQRPDLSPLRLLARAITPTVSPIRFHARFFQADAALATGRMQDSGELADLAFRPVRESLALPVFDITEAVLQAVRDDAAPFLFTYRAGLPRRRPLVAGRARN